ncbi:hypothetical protein CD144_05495 [Staphylococcus equorum subsp. linens]|uniref:hypothetical protein n=1 Tax=Staphylococcus equorum TaxID=246432 RepID=UPI0007048830|nr:hypothetical protein [Staphylococcus equorum]ALM56168.1 hypothetical protein SE1039_03850 [Staphylococcus equorum]MDK9843392.1 hypothetical protein [Staphylococcus equorum]MDN5637560.1 hypothetical protein [Staphylococcus equorum]PNZ07961.1 hypothetical protein CD144_05495 [Staphylococcus equorum subsp. linens]QQT17077.1 hypothetical protein I6J07_09210 [Staphylococcus equorum]
MIYLLVIIVVATLIGMVFLKRQKPTSPKSWLKGIGLIILSIIIVNGFYHIDEILNGAKKEQEDIQNRQNPK